MKFFSGLKTQKMLPQIKIFQVKSPSPFRRSQNRRKGGDLTRNTEESGVSGGGPKWLTKCFENSEIVGLKWCRT